MAIYLWEPNIPQVNAAERVNVNPVSLPKQREISDGEHSVSRKVMIEACDMSIISEMSALSKSTTKNKSKVKIATNLKKKNLESQLELFFSENEENDPSKINATQSVRTGSYSVATERSKTHSRFVDETGKRLVIGNPMVVGLIWMMNFIANVLPKI
jgi:hypothetical protein